MVNNFLAMATRMIEQTKGRIDVFVLGQLQKIHLWVTANKSICLLIVLVGIIYFALQMVKYAEAACMQVKENSDSEDASGMTIEEQQQYKAYSQKKIKQAIIIGLVLCIFNAFVSKMLDFH